MLKIVFASQNEHKLKEVNEILNPFNMVAEAPCEGFNPDESGTTFEENSIIKVMEAIRVENKGRELFLADDSGLQIEALNGEPGVYSARYAETPRLAIKKVLNNLEGITNRHAQFMCAMTLADKEGEILHKALGICKGNISLEPSGINGFGYDPIFIPNNYTETMAEIESKTKNLISHRGKALLETIIWLKLTKN